jgi:amino acid adenylation domain-containing protein
MAVRVKGPFSRKALQDSLVEIVHRHESLRTVFTELDGEPYQVVLDQVDIHLWDHDLSLVPVENKEVEANSLAERLVVQPFDLAKGPLLRVHLLKLGDVEHIVLIVMHHIVSDGWSMGVLVEEVITLYESFLAGKQPSLAPLPVQYPDYAIWQQEWFKGNVLQQQLDYWVEKLKDGPTLLDLPTDFPRSVNRTNKGGQFTFYFSPETTASLREIVQQEGVTMFMVLLAAFYILLYRYSGQEDINVGTPMANRSRVELERMIGFLANTLVLRADLSGNPSFRQLLKRIQEITLGAFDHPELPFEMLVDRLQPERDLSFEPLFQVMFAFQNTPRKTREVSGTLMEVLLLHSGTSKFDLTLVMGEGPRRVVGSIEYNTDLFLPQTISCMAEHFSVLVDAIIQNPECPIQMLPLLTEAEKKRVLIDFNQNQSPFPFDQTIVSLFEQQVERTPGQVAIVAETNDTAREISYLELNQRANQVARWLLAQGVKGNDLVCLFIERSIELLVGLMGILKAGCAYVPLDPVYPEERIQYILDDIAAYRGDPPVLLSTRQLTPKLPVNRGPVLFLDEDEILETPLENLNLAISPEDLCYVLYTSGSTGKPKGVMIEHRNVLNIWACLRKIIYFDRQGEGRRIGLNAPLLFDVSVGQWTMLLSGETIYVIPHHVRLDGKDLLGWLRKYRIQVLDCVPTQLKLLLQAGLLDRDGQWKPEVIMPAGEALDPTTWEMMLSSDEIDFVNLYGPTECTVYSSYYRIKDYPSKPVIGVGVSNTPLYVLDGRSELVPIGVPGELYIGGAGVGRGYFNKPDLTKNSFLPDKFHPGSRMYKTGDRVRWLDEGVLEFLGRADNQVKIRGFRIELGEIESALKQHPAVKEAVVIARVFKINAAEDKRLAAYLVLKDPSRSDHQEVLIKEIRGSLQHRLPDYMIPATFTILDALPLTPNGKLDRKRLPEPEFIRLEVEDSGNITLTPTEEILANIWKQLLMAEKIGLEDNFFEVGGHSLLITQLLSRVRSLFDVEISVRSFFEHSTIASLAGLIDQVRLSNQGIVIPPIRKHPFDQPLVLSFAQQRLWFLEQLQPGTPNYNIPSAVRLKGDLDVDLLQKSLGIILHRHDVLRTSFQTIHGKPQLTIVEETPFRIHLIDLSSLESSERENQAAQLAILEAQKPFDITQAPLLRVVLVKIAEGDHIIFWTFHHIVSDGWSSRIFLQELITSYLALLNGQLPDLPPLPIQYQDYAYWQREWLSAELLEKEISHWKEVLSGAPTLIDLPADMPRPPTMSGKGEFISFEIPVGITQRIYPLVQAEGVTLYMFLLAAFAVLLSRYSRQEDILIGSPIANRNFEEIEGLIGFFANTLVFRIKINEASASASFSDLLKLVKGVSLDAYNHSEVPFEMVVDAVQPERHLSHTPVFQVMFTLQNKVQSSRKFSESGFVINPLELHTKTSKFDLSLSIEEGEGKLLGALEYNGDIFQPETVDRITRNFIHLIEAVSADLSQPVSTVSFLSQEEKFRLLEEWNQTAFSIPANETIDQLFSIQARKTPGRQAVIALEQIDGVDTYRSLTYQELEIQSNKLARLLRKLGLKPQEPVGLYLPRSLDLITGLLGILKAGGAYLPLDPSYPPERLKFILEDVSLAQGEKILLITAENLLRGEEQEARSVICMDRDHEKIEQQSGEPVDRLSQPDSLAYIIFTSG